MNELRSTSIRVVVCLAAMLMSLAGFAQQSHAKWSAKLDPADARAGESARILVTAVVSGEYHMYAIQKPKTDGPAPVSTSIKLAEGGSLEPQGEAIEPSPTMIDDPGFGIKLGIHGGTTVFSLPVKIKPGTSGQQKATLEIAYQTCNDHTCDPPANETVEVSFEVASGEARADHLAALVATPDQPGGKQTTKPTPKENSGQSSGGDENVERLLNAQQTNLGAYLWICFLAGLASLLMPCVFPMIPITVSFFSKKSGEGEKTTNVSAALAYCLGIIATFTALGIVMTAIFGATGIQKLATNAFVNVFLAILFVALALSLFGLFEIVVPASVTTKLSNKGRAGGLAGPLFMGLTFSLTSFTCTVPVVGTLLLGASRGDYLYPTLGMLAFSTAFAFPFFLLALFPQVISKLPRSGAWMSTVKVFMGFFELAFALKFLSNIDLVLNLGWLTREVFLAVWAAIAFIGGLYLFGWIRLKTEEGPARVGLLRGAFGLATVAAGVLCLAGIQGFSLGKMDAFVPPNPYPGREAAAGPQSIPWVHDYKTALAQAKAENKLMLINFTGVTCTNCRQMEKNVLPKAEVIREMNGMIPVELYTDRPTAEDKFNKDLELKLANTVSLPVYVVVSPDERPLKVLEGLWSPDKFIAFLKEGKGNFGAVARR